MTYTKNFLLNKQVTILQPVDGYRASTDAVLISALVHKIKKSDSILDVGSGTGAISLCLAERFKDKNISITGLELQAQLCELSNLSAQENGFSFLNFLNFDIKKDKLKESFSHIITNPPYSEKDMPSPNESKALAHNHSEICLKDWITFCIKRLKPQGYFYIIHRAEAIDEILSIIHGKLGEIVVVPFYSKEGQNAKRIMVIGRLDSKAATIIDKGLTIHDKDGNYTPKAQEILREGKGYF